MAHDDRLFVIIGCTLLLVVGGAAAVLWFAESISGDELNRPAVNLRPIAKPSPPAVRSPVAHASSTAASPEPSEAPLRPLIRGISAHPGFAALLVRDKLIRRFVTSVDLIAGGYSPRDGWEELRPVSGFLVRQEAGRLVIASGSFRRYDTVAEIVDSIDVGGAIELFRRLEDRLDEVYHDVGWGRGPFEDRLREAIDHLLEVEPPAGSIEVEQRSIAYAFADDELERLTDAQRHLLRTGPRNAVIIQSKLREIRGAFGWPEARPSDETADPVMLAQAEPGVTPWRLDPPSERAELVAEIAGAP
jgi:hypothetical protein